MNDWDKTYIAGALAFLSGHDPYSYTKLFASPPYSLGFLIPLAWVPPGLAMIFPMLALLYLSIRFRKRYLLPVVGMSFPFIACSVYANIDWMIMIGVAIGGQLGVILDTIKPQGGVFAIVAEIAKRETLKERVRLLWPLTVCVIISIPLLGSWLHWMLVIGEANNGIRNFSLFPYTIPLGIVALWLAWKKKEPIWGCVASLALSPYFYIHSALPLVFLLAKKDWKLGLAATLVSWAIVALIIWGFIPIKL